MLDQSYATVIQMDSCEDSEYDLVQKAAHDPSAIGSLYRRYLDRVYRYLYARVGNRAEAEDLTSQVFLAVIESLPCYRERGHFAAWLFSIARRKAADYYRQRKPQVALDEAFNLASTSGEPLAQAIQVEERERLGKLIAGLREEERELLRLRFAAALSFDEIAVVCGRRQSAVKMSLYRLLERIQGQMEADHE